MMSSPNIIRVTKKKMGEECGTYGGEVGRMQGSSGGNPMERDYLLDLGVDERIKLKRIFKKKDEVCKL